MQTVKRNFGGGLPIRGRLPIQCSTRSAYNVSVSVRAQVAEVLPPPPQVYQRLSPFAQLSRIGSMLSPVLDQ